VPARKVTTKHLTDHYGAHQARGLKPATVYQVHACRSSMFTQACKWGWRDTNPAQWADPPSRPNVVPVIPTAEQVTSLIDAATASRRPEYARAIFIAATTGVRRGELCAIRCGRDIDWHTSALTVGHSMVDLPNRPLEERSTKNRRVRPVALDEFTLAMMRAQRDALVERARLADVDLVDDPFLFSDALDGSEPWRPSMVTRYFARLRERAGLDELDFHSLRKFMSTYGQDLGFSGSQVALRAGHDPSVAARYYTGRIADTDRALAHAVASLLVSNDAALNATSRADGTAE
jgi:integrase